MAILRFLWREFGNSKPKLVYQPNLAEAIGISLRTAQRCISEATYGRLIVVQISKRQPRRQGHYCEYGINLPGIYKKLGIPPGTQPNASKKTSIEEALDEGIRENAMKVHWLPRRFFKSALITKGKLHVVTDSDVQCILPDDGRDVLKYLTESHYHYPLPDESVDTLILRCQGGATSPAKPICVRTGEFEDQGQLTGLLC